MERRSKQRFEVCLDAIWDGARGNSRTRITDLSEGGCYVDSMSEAATGEMLHLKVELANEDWLDLTGEVVHTFPRLGFGLRFVALDPLQRQKLLALLERLSASSERPMARICA
ncbi:MAG TPA: PilZ domain-containing protein [Pyrinomonadaceae bacterium]